MEVCGGWVGREEAESCSVRGGVDSDVEGICEHAGRIADKASHKPKRDVAIFCCSGWLLQLEL
jgi:hypothetical protein